MKSESSTYYSTKPCPNQSSRNGKIVSKITIHHMAAITSATTCAASFYNPRRQASANYCICDNEIICCVPEEFRAWTSGSRWNDEQAITIEVANSSGKPEWTISKESYNALVKLCADICRRYNIKPSFTGDRNGTFTFHYMFQATECPGPYITHKINDIINDVNHLLEGSDQVPDNNLPEPSDSFLVRITCDDLNIRSGPGTKYKRTGHITDHGIYTIVESSGNWGKLKSGVGWICLKYTERI